MEQHQEIQQPAANGLQILKETGVPDGAVTALLILLSVLTGAPYVAGREFGPYSIPDVIQGGTFWVLAVLMPALWVVLVARVFRTDWQRRGRVLPWLLGLECLAVLAAFGSSAKQDSHYFYSELKPGQPSEPFLVDLPAVSRAQQRVDVKIDGLQGLEGPLPHGWASQSRSAGQLKARTVNVSKRGRATQW